MTKEINFLSERRKELSKQEKKDRRILMYASIFFGIVLTCFLVLFTIRLFLGQQLYQRKNAQADARQQITANESLERSFVVFVNKLSGLATIYQNKQDKKAVIDYFNSILAGKGVIRRIEFDQKEKLLVFRIQSDGVFQMKEIFALVNSDEVKSKFTSISSSDLKRQPDGRYEITVTVLAEKHKL